MFLKVDARHLSADGWLIYSVCLLMFLHKISWWGGIFTLVAFMGPVATDFIFLTNLQQISNFWQIIYEYNQKQKQQSECGWTSHISSHAFPWNTFNTREVYSNTTPSFEYLEANFCDAVCCALPFEEFASSKKCPYFSLWSSFLVMMSCMLFWELASSRKSLWWNLLEWIQTLLQQSKIWHWAL